jgi:hypothetical protein
LGWRIICWTARLPVEPADGLRVARQVARMIFSATSRLRLLSRASKHLGHRADAEGRRTTV